MMQNVAYGQAASPVMIRPAKESDFFRDLSPKRREQQRINTKPLFGRSLSPQPLPQGKW